MKAAAPGSLGALSLVDGLVVGEHWFAPGEGPFTVMAKIARANVLNARQLCRYFGAETPTSSSTGPHRRSLLHLGWLARRQPKSQLFAELWGRGLLARSERWSHSLASDRRLRYCPRCVAEGFQSAVCQIEGLTHCPTHGEELLDRCQACGAPTPPYAITPEAFDEPLHCSQCHQPFAPIWTLASWLQPRESTAEQAGYQQLARWLERVEQLDIQWTDQASWLGDPRAPVLAARQHKSRRLAGVLSALVPTPGCAISTVSWIGHWALLCATPEAEQPEQHKVAAGRVAIYKSIRRHYAKRYRVPVGAGAHSDRRQLLWASDQTMAMPSGEGADPARHGLLAWRLRFEETSASQGPGGCLKLFDTLLFWPLLWTAPDSAWAHFAHRSLLLDQAMSRALIRAMSGLDYERDADRARWLEVTSLWHHRFGSQARAWPDGLTFFRTPGPDGGPGRIHLVATPSVVCTFGEEHDH